MFEQNSYTGGKVTAFEQEGFRFDMGPSLFTLPHLVDELFELAGKNPRAYFNYHTHAEVCRYFWEDGTKLTMYSLPLRKTLLLWHRFLALRKRGKLRDYFEMARRKYDLTAPFFSGKESASGAVPFLTPASG